VRGANHAADLPIAAKIGGQDAKHPLGIKPVGLCALGSTVHQDAGRLDDMAVDVMDTQDPMQPEPIPARFEAARDINRLAQLGRDTRAQVGEERQQPDDIAGGQAMHPRFAGSRQARAD
jgi:hypothetical protein